MPATATSGRRATAATTCAGSRRSAALGGRAADYDRSVPAWLVWALIAVVLTIGEILTPGLFFLGPIAVAAVAAMVAATLGGGWVVELIVFVAGAGASLGVLRPI